ncbi:hypothetical protein YP76_04710 [Sphingobium chungbukense]|uniref:DUF2188 domain-containing protein n=2 Tax=Sphingobium chungbukense TaxID=56193 RepID=A0A0M3AVK2_9SPHN|nr:hypothetical protein YP76_04710 [Sphingobium chungbukense]
MAWRRNPERDPRFRLQTEGEAMAEAERLAKQRPGSTYIVMREIARVTFSNSVPAATPPQAAGGAGRRLSPQSPGSKEECGDG